jgi:hypothetical protein
MQSLKGVIINAPFFILVNQKYINMDWLCQYDLNTLGLFMNLAGAILLFIFGTPFRWDTSNGMIWRYPTKKQKFIKRMCDFLSSLGMFLVIVGFAFQYYYSNC